MLDDSPPSLRARLGVLAAVAMGLAVIAAWVEPKLALAPVGLGVLLAAAAEAWMVMHRPMWLVLALVVLTTFESLILKLLPLPSAALFASQFAAELAIDWGLIVALGWRWRRGRGWRRTPADLPLMAFALVVVLTMMVNQPPVMGSLLNVRSLLRYAALFYLVVNLDLTPRQVRVVLGCVLVAGGIQLAAGLAQWIGGEAVKAWMMPRAVDLSVAGMSRQSVMLRRGREMGAVFGTFGDTLYFALFLLIVLAVGLACWREGRWWRVLLALPLLVGIALSYSRAAALVSGLTIVLFLWQRGGLRPAVALAALVLAAALLVGVGAWAAAQTYLHPRQVHQSALGNLTGFLSRDYIERAKRQRLGSLLGTAPTALRAAPLLGLGPDEATTIDRLNAVVPSRLYKTLTKRGFEDVYWVALLCYYGMLGIAALVWLMIRLIRACMELVQRSRDPTTRWAAAAAVLVLLQAPVMMLFVRVLEFRIFGFYYWLLPALALSLAAYERAAEAARDPKAQGDSGLSSGDQREQAVQPGQVGQGVERA